MKYLLILFAILFSTSSYSQSTSCEPNMDFELGNFSYWKYYQGTCCIPLTVTTSVTPPSTATTGRETITSGTGTDPYGGFPVVAPSGSYSLKLGQDDDNRKADKARYYIHVPSSMSNYALVYRYAIVLQDPRHKATEQPRFNVNTTDSATGSSVSCGNFSYVAGSLPGFTLSTVDTTVWYRSWATATINLSGLNGHTVIVDFTRGDCELGAHFGYGYIDMTCGLFAITINPCHYDATTTLSGPPGFQRYIWMDSTYSTVVDSGQSITITTPSVSTTYRLILTPYSGYGCTDTLTTRVLISNLALHPRDTTICSGKTVNLNIGATGGFTPLTYSWTPTTGLSCTTCSGPGVTLTSSKKFIVTVSDSTGCSRTDSMQVHVNALPNINAGADKVICNGSSVSINPTGGATYVWSPSTGLSCSTCTSPSASPTSTTTYVVTGTDTNGCVNTDTIKVKVNTLPNVNAGADKTICYNNSTTLTATGAPSYSWSPSTGLSCSSCASPTATPTSTTTYVVTGTDTNNCVKTDTVIVQVNPLPIVSAGADKAICNGKNDTLKASGASTYSWSPSSGLSCSSCASPSASPTSTTTYVVTGTDSNNCQKTDTVIVKVNPLPNVNAGADKTICLNNSTTLTASGASTYVWSPSTGLSCSSCTSPTASPTGTTTYIVTGTDTNSCVKTDTVVVHVNSLPPINAGPDKTICYNNSTTITATGASGYSWSPSTGLSCSSCASPTATPVSTTTYVVTGTDSNSCQKTDTVVVKVNPLPNVNAGTDKTICFGNNDTLKASGASTYSWSPSTGLSCSSCASPTVSPSGTTTYVVTGTDSNNCVKTDTVKVNVNPLPNVNAGTDKTICLNNSTTLTVSGAATYVWSPSTGLSCTTCTSPTASPTSTTTYIVTGTDTNTCVKTDTVKVNVNPLPNVNAGPDKIICMGNSVTLTGFGATSYVWSPSTGLSCVSCTSTTASPTSTSTYVVTGTDANGCTNTDTVVVKVNSLPVVNAGVDKAICYGSSTTLTGTGASTYSWSPSTGLSCTTCTSPTASPTGTTTYIVTGTDTNNCVKTDTIVVKVNPLPTVSAGADKFICLNNSTTLTGSGAYTYVWSPSTGLSCSSCTSTTASPTSTTTYVVTGTDTNSCVKTDTVVVNVNSLPGVNGGPDKTICYNNSTTLTATGATSFVWSPSTGLSCTSCTSPTATPTSTTTYVVTGTDTNSCNRSDTVIVNVNPLPTVNAGPDKTICYNSSTTLTVTGASTYSWSPSTGLSCGTCATLSGSPASTTTYVVTGTDSNSCSKTDTVVVKVNPLPTVNAGADKSICLNNSTTLTGSGAYTYVWSPSTGLSCSSCTSTTASPTSTTTYVVTGTDTNSCVKTDTVVVNVNSLPGVNGGPDKTICYNNSTALTATGATSYVWSPSTGLSCTSCTSPTATPTSTTTYVVTGTDTNSCNRSDTVIVNVNPLPTVNAGPDKTICYNSSTTLTVTGASTYSWSPSTGLSCGTCATLSGSPASTTTYVVTGTDSNSCSKTDTVVVKVNPLPTVNAGADKTICYNNSTALTVTGGSTYSWSPSVGLSCGTCSAPTATPTSTTTYIVTGTDTNSCVKTDTVIVNVNPLPAVNAGPDKVICYNNNTTLMAGGASTYVWSPTTGLSCSTCATPTVSPTSTTTYVLTGTDSNSCYKTDTVVVKVNALPTVSAGPDKAVCIGNSTNFYVTGASTYSWSPSTGLSCSTCTTPATSATVTSTYVVTGTDTNGCVNTDTITLKVNPLPKVNAGPDKYICNNETSSITATGASTYIWSPSIGLSCSTCATSTVSPVGPVSYIVTGTDTNGCSNTDTIAINIKPIPAIVAGPDTAICQGNSAMISVSGAVSYIWYPASTLSCGGCDTTIAKPTATTKYTVVGIGANGCKDTSAVTVTVHDLPVIVIDGNTKICDSTSTQLSASGAQHYTWTPPTSLSCPTCSNPIASPTNDIEYVVVGSNAFGCIDSSKIALSVIKKLPIEVGKDDTICQGQSAQLYASGGTDYLWSPAASLNNNQISNPIATPQITTQYKVVVKQGKCFVDSGLVNVTVVPKPSVNLGGDRTILVGSSVQLNATIQNAISYEWSPITGLSCTDCPDPIATPKKTTTYSVYVKGLAGCDASASVTITVKCENSQVFIPNSFTPNSDGKNDRFFPNGKGIAEVKRFSVYDRWGELIFDAHNFPINDMKYGWDGTYKGVRVKPDVFVYIMDATCETGDLLEFKGDVSIVK